MSLRPYQQRIVDDAMNEYTNYTRPFVVDAFQASGKSWMIAEIAKRVGKCLILCMNKELVEQDAEKIRAVGAECSIYSASCGEKVISNITVATIGSIYKHPEYCQHFNLVIVDEADQVPVDKKDSMYMKLFHQIRKPVMGWTGTAFRTAYNYSRLKNGDVVQSTVIKSLDKFNFWGKVVGGVTYQELLDEMPRVRADLGYPPLVTPSSQIVGTMATMNVIMQANGQPRYTMVPNEVRDLARGKFGKTPAPVKPEVLKAMKIKPEEMVTDCAVEDAKAPTMDDFRKELAGKKVDLKLASIRSQLDSVDPAIFEQVRASQLEKVMAEIPEEDVLSYALFPQVAEAFFKANGRM